jgi:ketosteroid isomerase-like protein
MRNLCTASMLVVVYLLGSVCDVRSQNIPPLIGDKVGKPKIAIPNPLDRQGQQREGSNQSYSTSAQDAEIHSFLDSFVKSLADRDLEKIGACYSQQPGLVVYWNSQEFQGWEAVQTHWQKALDEMGGAKWTLSDSDVHVFGRFAWVTAKYHRESLEQGKPLRQDNHVTFVLEKRRAQWLILHEHVSQGSGS